MSDRPAKKTRPLEATFTVRDMPELQALYRRELAEILREAAADVSPEAAAELRAIADLFEAGLREEP